jgi:hypothetical protein
LTILMKLYLKYPALLTAFLTPILVKWMMNHFMIKGNKNEERIDHFDLQFSVYERLFFDCREKDGMNS